MRYSELIENVINSQQHFYHGTSSSRMQTIKSNGLTPQTDVASFSRGNSSTINGWTDKCIYITTDKTIAKRYAVNETKFSGGNPVILEVDLMDSSKLHVDDDFIIDYVYKQFAAENGVVTDDVDEAIEASDNITGILLGMNIIFTGSLSEVAEECYNDIEYAKRMKQYAIKAAKMDWHNSLPNIAYMGIIPPQNIREIEL
jgi:hypothetical protein